MKKDLTVFKFSISRTKNPDLVVYLQSIKNKSKREEWITNVVRLLKKVENSLGIIDFGTIEKFVEDCLTKTSKNRNSRNNK